MRRMTRTTAMAKMYSNSRKRTDWSNHGASESKYQLPDLVKNFPPETTRIRVDP
jgi:hypothetical protein